MTEEIEKLHREQKELSKEVEDMRVFFMWHEWERVCEWTERKLMKKLRKTQQKG